MKELSHNDYNLETVRGQILELLNDRSPLRFTDIMDKLGKPNRTVYIYLKYLQDKALVSVSNHNYSITERGREVYQKSKDITLWTAGKPSFPHQPGTTGYTLKLPKKEGEYVWLPPNVLRILKERSREKGVPVSTIIEGAIKANP